jgi:hypothetical protein
MHHHAGQEHMSASDQTKLKDPIMRWLALATGFFIALCVLLIAWSASDLMIGAGIVAGGTAFVLVLAIAFYAVGRSEDGDGAARVSGPDDPA